MKPLSPLQPLEGGPTLTDKDILSKSNICRDERASQAACGEASESFSPAEFKELTLGRIIVRYEGIKQPNLAEASCESITTCGRSDSFISCTLPEATIQDMSAFSLALSFPGSKAVVKIIIILRWTLYCKIKLRGRPAVSTVSSSNSAAQFLLLSVASAPSTFIKP